MDKKFIITQDTQTADFLMASGFQLVGHMGTSYTFLNDIPKNFNFANLDKSKIAYSSVLCM